METVRSIVTKMIDKMKYNIIVFTLILLFVTGCLNQPKNHNVRLVSSSNPKVSMNAVNWITCATENRRCRFVGTKQVRYGKNGKYIYRTYTNGVLCSHRVFGGDPNFGVYKECAIRGTDLTRTNVTRICNFSSEPGKEKCPGASGNQCEGGDPRHPPNYDHKNCLVTMFVTEGSKAHDACCQKNSNGYACKGCGILEPLKNIAKTIPCEKEWQRARNNSLSDRGVYHKYGPYFEYVPY